ncbi:MAG: sialidase family protein, partial [Candidatus Poribacteria bacterium]|nr:sialidase family protein [Candidatus Poribacteria bacterium]
MTNNLSLTFILTPLLLAVWFSASALNAHADWEHIPGTEVIGRVRLLESDGPRLYAVGDTGFYLSFDDGYTWRRREIGRGLEEFYITAIGSGDGAVYVGTTFHGVFRSDDGGNTWKHINEGLQVFDSPKWGPRHGIVEQLLVTGSGTVINVGYHYGTHISDNRGETWHSVLDEWIYPGNPDWRFGDSIWSMTEFDSYLWAVYSSTSGTVLRSADKGQTWESLPVVVPGNEHGFGQISDWAAIEDKLYVAGYLGFGRWNEAERMWENLSRGFPDVPYMNQLAVNRRRIFATFYGLDRGVWLFDHPS